MEAKQGLGSVLSSLHPPLRLCYVYIIFLSNKVKYTNPNKTCKYICNYTIDIPRFINMGSPGFTSYSYMITVKIHTELILIS